MAIFSYHLLEISFLSGLKRVFSKPVLDDIPGLIYSEYMNTMTLGSPIFSKSRFILNEIAVFMQWEDEDSLESFLKNNIFGKELSKGWHLRLIFLRQWGSIKGFKIPLKKENPEKLNTSVVAVTIARMKPFQIPRFLKWGRPVERLVRDHDGTIISLAAFNLPNLVSTFSIWKNETEMTNMVHGHSKMPKPKRHSKAMIERERKNFHFEFTTLRFKPISEFGSWKGKTNYINFN